MEPEVGIEPTACSLRVSCSTTELHWPIQKAGVTYLFPLDLQIPLRNFVTDEFDFGAGDEEAYSS